MAASADFSSHYQVYQLSRAATAAVIRGNNSVSEKARQHALSILSFEQIIGVGVEQSFQQWVLQRCPSMMTCFGVVYRMHIIVGVAFLMYAYTFFPIKIFQRIRRTIALDNAIAFVILSTWRCMPPRLLPAEYGYVDVLHKSATVWSENKHQLTIAAMPSLHFGTAGFISLCLWRFAPPSHKAIHILAPLYPLAMLTTIMATANHFLLDALVGAMIPVMAWHLHLSMTILRPLEEAAGMICGIERPAQTDPTAIRDDLEVPQRGLFPVRDKHALGKAEP